MQAECRGFDSLHLHQEHFGGIVRIAIAFVSILTLILLMGIVRWRSGKLSGVYLGMFALYIGLTSLLLWMSQAQV